MSATVLDKTSAIGYLQSLLNHSIRAHTTDGRMFLGDFKCTDNESNIILAKTYEYRMPTEKAKQEALDRQRAGAGHVKADMTSRFLGLVVVPGRHITKLEVEEKKPWQLPLRPGPAEPNVKQTIDE